MKQMAEATQFSFSWQEVAELLMKASNIHEGKWAVGLEFSVTVGAMGLKPTEASPGAMITAHKLMITAVTEGQPQPPNLVFDAALLNPRHKTHK
jgi:hypothetical protein